MQNDLPLVTLPASIPFLQAKYFTKATAPRQVDWLVMHAAQDAETLGAADSLMRQCAEGIKIRMPDGSIGESRASWHKAFDAKSVTQSVLLEDIAWHASGANRKGIGYEICGDARQTPEEWMDPFSIMALELAAWQGSIDCGLFQIPAVFVDAEGLKAGLRGVTTHAEVSKAFPGDDHWDPGPFFPMEHFLSRITWWYTHQEPK